MIVTFILSILNYKILFGDRWKINLLQELKNKNAILTKNLSPAFGEAVAQGEAGFVHCSDTRGVGIT